MRNKILCLTLLTVLLGSGVSAYGQATASPYSLFGIGEIDMGNHGESSGMAGLGIGLQQPNALNNLNPAALTAIYPQTFIFDGSFYGKLAWYTGQGQREYAGSGNIRRIALGFRAARPWAISVGLTPYSKVGYDIRTQSPIEGSVSGATYESSFTGSGGLNKLYIGQSFNITPKLSIGVNASLIFGTVRHNEKDPYWRVEKKSRGEKVYFDFGAQYVENVGQNKYLTVGLVGGYQTEMKMYNTHYAYDYDGNVVTNKVIPSTRQSLPEFYGGGVSLSSRNLVIGADYLFQRWSRIKSSGSVQYKDMQKLTVGLSYVPNPLDPRSIWQRARYQFGASANDSYLSARDKSKINYSVSAGIVLPMRSSNSVHFNVEYGKNGFQSGRNAVREDFLRVTFGFSFKEAWFLKYRYD